MPVTFFAHQAPVLPLARRWSDRLDGLTLVVGSMAPDMAYVLNGSRWSVWAHGFPGVVAFCVPVAAAVAWIVVRVIAPVVPDHLPDLTPWHLRDYRGLAVHRFGWISTPASALVGAATHVVLDNFTHEWGWVARNMSWYGDVFFTGPFGRHWTGYRIAQYVGHVVGTALCVGMLARLGRERWMADRAAIVPRSHPSPRSIRMLMACTVAGGVAGLAWVASEPLGSATDIMRVTATTFVGLVTGSLAVSQSRPGSRAQPRHPTPIDRA